MLGRKLQAGALQLTTFIAVVIALLLVAFILLVHTHKRFALQTDFIIETVKNTDKGLNYSFTHTIPLNDTVAIDLKDEDYKSLKVQRDFWGFFEKVSVTSKIKKNTAQKIVLVGATQVNNYRNALYLQDNNKPLVLVGHTEIQGVAYLPQQGVKPGTIAGQSFYGSNLVNGIERISNTLPELESEMLDNLKGLAVKQLNINSENHIDIELGKQYNNSFLNPTKYIFSASEIDLRFIEITGNIIIKSSSKITVQASAKLKDVLLIAPEIDIKNNTRGRFQSIAINTVNVGENVLLNYPSALILNENKTQIDNINLQTDDPTGINIHKNSVIKGVVVFLGVGKPNNYKPQIVIEESALVNGEVYCEQNLELRGAVYGSVFTNNFVANQSGSIYQNHIYNGVIKIDELPEEYVGLTFTNSKKGILKCLY